MAWVFLVVNIITLLSNLGIELYKRWKHRDDENIKPINPNDIIQSIDSTEEKKNDRMQ